MSSPTIADLRHRAWGLANTSIDVLNGLNDVIYEDSPNKPMRINNKPEDMTNISFQYIQDGMDIFNSRLFEIRQKRDYLISIQKKHQECLKALSQLME